MAGKPACTLFHLGPGLSNASANIHNARKAHSPMINLVGDHATYHKQFDAPLNSDVIGLSEPVSHWVRSVADARSLPGDAAEAVASSRVLPGRIATLIVPADCAWDDSVAPAEVPGPPRAPLAEDAAIAAAVDQLGNGRNTVILLSNMALSETALELADRIGQQTGARIFCDTFFPRLPRGEGRPEIERLGYFAEQAMEQISEAEQLIMVGTKAPVGFFAYPGKASEFAPEGATLHTLARADEDAEDALARVCDGVSAADLKPRRKARARPGFMTGELSSRAIGVALAELLPEEAIVVDEGGTAGSACFPACAGAASHDWLTLTGGSIGFGLPQAVGAAVACPDRKVVCIHGDGGAMYTIQSLWTMAREDLDICVVIFANRKYQILQIELARVGAQTMNKKTLDMLDLSNPDLDFVKLSEGMGVPAARATTADEFNELLGRFMSERGPRLIEALLP
jgi:acetolactate synthase-1/2/3 large subunit